MNREETGIIRLLSYTELFGFPLRESEIVTYFLGDFLPERENLKNTLTKLVAQGILCYDASSRFYFFPDGFTLVGQRQKREEASRVVLSKAVRIAKFLGLLPWVKLIGVTGSLSCLGSSDKDDIDLMVVTAHKRLWLTRLIVFAFLKLLRLKKGSKKSHDFQAICINVWMDEEDLVVGTENQDLVIAYDLARVKVLVDKEEIYPKMILLNLWIADFLPMYVAEFPTGKVAMNQASKYSRMRWSTLLDRLEEFAYRIQLKVIRQNFPGNPHIQESATRLWQHPTDSRGRIQVRYEDNLRRRLRPLDIPTSLPIGNVRDRLF